MANKILRMGTDLKFEEIEISNIIVQYEELSGAVGGYIERVTFNRELDENGIDVWCDEEYRLKGSTPSVMVVNDSLSVIECLGGNLVFTAQGNFDGESYALEDWQIDIIKRVLSRMAVVKHGAKVYQVRLMKWK